MRSNSLKYSQFSTPSKCGSFSKRYARKSSWMCEKYAPRRQPHPESTSFKARTSHFEPRAESAVGARRFEPVQELSRALGLDAQIAVGAAFRLAHSPAFVT